MPTQWDEDDTRIDPATGWTKSKFESTAQGTTYHTASAAAAVIAVINAALEKPIKEELATVNISSFYGTLRFDAKGKIQKPMAVLQRAGSNNVVASDANVKLLSTCGSWISHTRNHSGTPPPPTTTNQTGDTDSARSIVPGIDTPWIVLAAVFVFSGY